MCAFAGFYNPFQDYKKDEPRYETILKKMCEVQKHRGPDNSGVWLFEQGGLCHARLSIIDLTTGDQPMKKSRRRIYLWNHIQRRNLQY